jgi:hypothetical protein
MPYCEPELLQATKSGILTTSTSWRCASVVTSELLQESSQIISTPPTTTTTSQISTSTPGPTTPVTTPPTTAPATTVIIISVENGNTYSSSIKLTSSDAANNPGAVAAGTVGAGTGSASTGPQPSAQVAGLSAASSTASAGASSAKSSNTGAIAGGVTGGVIFIALIAGLVFFLLKKKRSSTQQKAGPSDASGYPAMTPDPYASPPGPKELYSPANNDKWSNSGSSEMLSSTQYQTQYPALSHSNLVELESSNPGTRMSHYAPGQQTRPQQEMSDMNYPDRSPRHFQVELPG